MPYKQLPQALELGTWSLASKQRTKKRPSKKTFKDRSYRVIKG